MNTLFWLITSLSGIAFLLLSLTGLTYLVIRQAQRVNALLRLGLAGVCFIQLVGMYCLHNAGHQTTALWLTLTLWLMMAVVGSTLVLLRLGERDVETGPPSSPTTGTFDHHLVTSENSMSCV